MWIVTGVLLGLARLGRVHRLSLRSARPCPSRCHRPRRSRCLAYMVVTRPGPVLWSLLGADLIIGLGIGVLGWKGLTRRPEDSGDGHSNSLEGEQGIATTHLAPEGLVRVRGELWSAISINGTVPASTPVQVVRATLRTRRSLGR